MTSHQCLLRRTRTMMATSISTSLCWWCFPAQGRPPINWYSRTTTSFTKCTRKWNTRSISRCRYITRHTTRHTRSGATIWWSGATISESTMSNNQLQQLCGGNLTLVQVLWPQLPVPRMFTPKNKPPCGDWAPGSFGKVRYRKQQIHFLLQRKQEPCWLVWDFISIFSLVEIEIFTGVQVWWQEACWLDGGCTTLSLSLSLQLIGQF